MVRKAKPGSAPGPHAQKDRRRAPSAATAILIACGVLVLAGPTRAGERNQNAVTQTQLGSSINTRACTKAKHEEKARLREEIERLNAELEEAGSYSAKGERWRERVKDPRGDDDSGKETRLLNAELAAFQGRCG
jgi:hypothetical protein